jgi:HlyD family secretion protein
VNHKVAIVAGVIVLVGVLSFGLFTITQPNELVFQGQVEAREVDVAAKVVGRVSKMFVREGDTVALDDALFELDSPELSAKMLQASSGRDAALAVSNKADSGARTEEIQMARFAWEGAQSAAELAHKTFERFDTLYKEGLISAQKYDEAMTKANASADAAKAARAQYDMAVNGARAEDKAAALAVVGQADGVVAEVSAYEAETHLKAPIAGEVSQVLVDIGELAPAGYPVMTLVDLSDAWVVLNVREDYLEHFKMGAKLTGTVPALGNKEVSLSVYFISVQADFATWRATRYSSGYDIKTFEIKMRPTEAVDGLRPGMSVLLGLN